MSGAKSVGAMYRERVAGHGDRPALLVREAKKGKKQANADVNEKES